jgi:hypothetical protein
MGDEPTQFLLTLGAGADSDDAELAELGRQLRNQLLELPSVDAVNPLRAGTAPAGAKGDPAIWATLAVTLAPIALTELIKIAQAWLTRHDRATLTVESGGEKITITGTPSKEQTRLLENFVGRHKK